MYIVLGVKHKFPYVLSTHDSYDEAKEAFQEDVKAHQRSFRSWLKSDEELWEFLDDLVDTYDATYEENGRYYYSGQSISVVQVSTNMSENHDKQEVKL